MNRNAVMSLVERLIPTVFALAVRATWGVGRRMETRFTNGKAVTSLLPTVASY